MCLVRLDDIIINKKLSSININGEDVSLEPKLFELLLLFCQRKDEIISRQQLLDEIWPNSIVTDNAVNKLIASLRKTLNDDPKNPRYIQTVPKRGYRLIATVEELTDEPTIQNSPANNSIQTTTKPEAKDLQAVEKKSSSLTLYSVLIAAIFIAYLLIFWQPSQFVANAVPSSTPMLKTQELTRMPGLERSPLMSSDHSFLVYLRENPKTGHRSLWRKSQTNEQQIRIEGLSPYASRLFGLDKKEQNWQLSYLAQENNACHVSIAELDNSTQLKNHKQLFDCTGFRVFDVAWAASKHVVYYSAKAVHENVSRVYQFDLESQTHSLITQPEAKGLGNRGIDVSPDGKKLLIVRLNKDFSSQIHVLDLQTNQLSTGFSAPYNLKKASWSHDSTHVLFYNPSPSHQIIQSDLDGSNQQTLVSVSEYLETEFTRIENSQDILFSTTNLNFNNRWVTHTDALQEEISNSTVYDMRPTLAHNSYNYAFVSTRSGQEQVYFGNLQNGNSQALSRLSGHQWYEYLSFSPNDDFLLTGNVSHIWLLDLKAQLKDNSLVDLNADNALFSTEDTLLIAVWLNNDYLYVKLRKDSEIKGYILNRHTKDMVAVDKRWQTLLSDHKTADTIFMVDPGDSQVYQLPMHHLEQMSAQHTLKFPESAIKATGVFLDPEYFDIKIHDNKIYYVTASHSGNAVPYDFQIEVVPIKNNGNDDRQVYKTSCSCGYDIADSGFMVSEQVNIEGDVHRTVH